MLLNLFPYFFRGFPFMFNWTYIAYRGTRLMRICFLLLIISHIFAARTVTSVFRSVGRISMAAFEIRLLNSEVTKLSIMWRVFFSSFFSHSRVLLSNSSPSRLPRGWTSSVCAPSLLCRCHAIDTGHAIFPLDVRWGGKIAWRVKRTFAKEASKTVLSRREPGHRLLLRVQ